MRASETAAPTPTFTPTPAETPKPPAPKVGVVEEGSFWAQAGVPVGMPVEKQRYPGEDFAEYIVFSPVNNREIIIGRQDKNGKVIPAEFLSYQLVSCYAPLEEILANEVSEELARSGALNRIAMLNDREPFPEDVLLGQKIKAHGVGYYDNDDFHKIGTGKALVWEREPQRKFDADPEKMPHRIVGCYSFRPALDSDYLYIALVHKWQNQDGSYRYITIARREDFYSQFSPGQYVFVYGWFVVLDGDEESPNKFIDEIMADPQRNAILDQWLESQAVPLPAENSIFRAAGPEMNYGFYKHLQP